MQMRRVLGVTFPAVAWEEFHTWLKCSTCGQTRSRPVVGGKAVTLTQAGSWSVQVQRYTTERTCDLLPFGLEWPQSRSDPHHLQRGAFYSASHRDREMLTFYCRS